MTHTLSLFILLISGCSEQPDTYEALNRASDYLLLALVKGQYQNASNNDVFELADQAHFLTSKGNFSKPYFIEDQRVIIVMKRKEKEQRPNLSLTIIDNGNQLSCLSCAKFGLASQWFKR